MSKKAKVTLDPAYQIGTIEPRLYGAFLEPIGSWVYGGVWNPDHPTADDLGFRKDVLDAIQTFDMPAVRLPGGNFMSGWEWKDSIGPLESRKGHLDLAWRQYEPNRVGHDEYLEWAKRANTEAMYTLNLGTGTIESAMHCVEYTNHPGGTYWSDLRKKNGHEEPYGVKTWYLGNEADGPWQIASWEKDPRGYGIKAYETAKVLKWIDPSIETAVCGSSSPLLNSYPHWERKVLEQCYPLFDYLSLHYYHWAPEGDIAGFLNGATLFENFINTEIAVCDYVQAKYRSQRKMKISFDEYGYGFEPQGKQIYGRNGNIPLEAYGEFQEFNLGRPFRYNDPNRVMDPPHERRYEMLNALGLTSVLLCLIRHADRVKIGCMTGGIRGAIAFNGQNTWNAATYYPYYQLRHYAKGTAILPAVEAPTFTSEGYNIDNFHEADTYENVSYLDVAASHQKETGEAAIFLINRNWEEPMEIELDVRGFEGYHLVEHQEMYSEDLNATNTYGREMIKPVQNLETKMENGKIYLTAKKLSWNMIRLSK